MKKALTFTLELATLIGMFGAIYIVWLFMAAMTAPAPV